MVTQFLFLGELRIKITKMYNSYENAIKSTIGHTGTEKSNNLTHYSNEKCVQVLKILY